MFYILKPVYRLHILYVYLIKDDCIVFEALRTSIGSLTVANLDYLATVISFLMQNKYIIQYQSLFQWTNFIKELFAKRLFFGPLTSWHHRHASSVKCKHRVFSCFWPLQYVIKCYTKKIFRSSCEVFFSYLCRNPCQYIPQLKMSSSLVTDKEMVKFTLTVIQLEPLIPTNNCIRNLFNC